MSREQQKRKRKHSALNSEDELENKELDPEEHPMENNSSSNTVENKGSGGLINHLEEQDNPTHELDNQSSNSHLTEFLGPVNEDLPDSSTKPKRTRFDILPDSDTAIDDYNDLVLPPFSFPLCVQSPASSSSTDNNHLSSVGLTGSSNSLNSDRGLPDSDNGSEENLFGEGFSALEVPEIIDLSSPVLPRGSSDVVDLTVEPTSPARSNFVDLTCEAVDSSPVIVSVNKIYQRKSVIQPRPSCRFEVTPSCSSSQDNSISDITGNKCSNNDDDVSIKNVSKDSCVNNSIIEATSSGEGKKNEKEQFHKSITCPICLDDAHLIKRKRQLSSTTCGHVFCDKCIKNAVKTQNKCPTCRKKLTLRQIHPLFL